MSDPTRTANGLTIRFSGGKLPPPSALPLPPGHKSTLRNMVHGGSGRGVVVGAISAPSKSTSLSFKTSTKFEAQEATRPPPGGSVTAGGGVDTTEGSDGEDSDDAVLTRRGSRNGPSNGSTTRTGVTSVVPSLSQGTSPPPRAVAAPQAAPPSDGKPELKVLFHACSLERAAAGSLFNKMNQVDRCLDAVSRLTTEGSVDTSTQAYHTLLQEFEQEKLMANELFKARAHVANCQRAVDVVPNKAAKLCVECDKVEPDVWCGNCKRGWHKSCRQPPLPVSRAWYCPECRFCRCCFKLVAGDGITCRWRRSYTCCSDCGNKKSRSFECAVCRRPQQRSRMIYCQHCEEWYHVVCHDLGTNTTNFCGGVPFELYVEIACCQLCARSKEVCTRHHFKCGRCVESGRASTAPLQGVKVKAHPIKPTAPPKKRGGGRITSRGAPRVTKGTTRAGTRAATAAAAAGITMVTESPSVRQSGPMTTASVHSVVTAAAALVKSPNTESPLGLLGGRMAAGSGVGLSLGSGAAGMVGRTPNVSSVAYSIGSALQGIEPLNMPAGVNVGRGAVHPMASGGNSAFLPGGYGASPHLSRAPATTAPSPSSTVLPSTASSLLPVPGIPPASKGGRKKGGSRGKGGQQKQAEEGENVEMAKRKGTEAERKKKNTPPTTSATSSSSNTPRALGFNPTLPTPTSISSRRSNIFDLSSPIMVPAPGLHMPHGTTDISLMMGGGAVASAPGGSGESLGAHSTEGPQSLPVTSPSTPGAISPRGVRTPHGTSSVGMIPLAGARSGGAAGGSDVPLSPHLLAAASEASTLLDHNPTASLPSHSMGGLRHRHDDSVGLRRANASGKKTPGSKANRRPPEYPSKDIVELVKILRTPGVGNDIPSSSSSSVVVPVIPGAMTVGGMGIGSILGPPGGGVALPRPSNSPNTVNIQVTIANMERAEAAMAKQLQEVRDKQEAVEVRLGLVSSKFRLGRKPSKAPPLPPNPSSSYKGLAPEPKRAPVPGIGGMGIMSPMMGGIGMMNSSGSRRGSVVGLVPPPGSSFMGGLSSPPLSAATAAPGAWSLMMSPPMMSLGRSGALKPPTANNKTTGVVHTPAFTSAEPSGPLSFPPLLNIMTSSSPATGGALSLTGAATPENSALPSLPPSLARGSARSNPQHPSFATIPDAE